MTIARVAVTAGLCVQGTAAFAQSSKPPIKYERETGLPGKDVVFIPTAPVLVAKMLDMAKVTSDDYVIDLGSGDGRLVIAAARRGARAMGIEYNPELVELSKHNAEIAGVADRATFVQGDVFESDFSKATVITTFLLPAMNLKLRPKLLALAPGSRIVANTFSIQDWEPDEKFTVKGQCFRWCTALLWIVPAKVDGAWHMAEGDLTLRQEYQKISGTLGSKPIGKGRLRGDEITFTVGDAVYAGRVQGKTMRGTVTSGKTGRWSASRR